MTGTMWDVIMNFIATDKENYSDLRSTPWGNYKDSTLTNCKGRYLTVNSSNGAVTSDAIVSDGSRHYGIMTTGSTEDVKKKNMYDLAGNLWEWTQEASYSASAYVFRGGDFSHVYSQCPTYYRGYPSRGITSTCTSYGFRPVLYIK